MFAAIGFVLLFVFVFGVYIVHGGDMGPIIKAAPFEVATILGAGIAAMLIGNDIGTIKGVAGGLARSSVDRNGRSRTFSTSSFSYRA